VLSPQLRKPTDLMMLMAQAMQHTLKVMGVPTKSQVSRIYSAQDASNYLNEAASLVAQRGVA